MSKIWIKNPDPNKQCCGCEIRSSPCGYCDRCGKLLQPEDAGYQCPALADLIIDRITGQETVEKFATGYHMPTFPYGGYFSLPDSPSFPETSTILSTDDYVYNVAGSLTGSEFIITEENNILTVKCPYRSVNEPYIAFTNSSSQRYDGGLDSAYTKEPSYHLPYGSFGANARKTYGYVLGKLIIKDGDTINFNSKTVEVDSFYYNGPAYLDEDNVKLSYLSESERLEAINYKKISSKSIYVPVLSIDDTFQSNAFDTIPSAALKYTYTYEVLGDKLSDLYQDEAIGYFVRGTRGGAPFCQEWNYYYNGRLNTVSKTIGESCSDPSYSFITLSLSLFSANVDEAYLNDRNNYGYVRYNNEAGRVSQYTFDYAGDLFRISPITYKDIFIDRTNLALNDWAINRKYINSSSPVGYFDAKPIHSDYTYNTGLNDLMLTAIFDWTSAGYDNVYAFSWNGGSWVPEKMDGEFTASSRDYSNITLGQSIKISLQPASGYSSPVNSSSYTCKTVVFFGPESTISILDRNNNPVKVSDRLTILTPKSQPAP